MTLIELLERLQVALASGVPEDAEHRFGLTDEDLVEPNGTRWTWTGDEWRRVTR